jgi:hypothetical protein
MVRVGERNALVRDLSTGERASRRRLLAALAALSAVALMTAAVADNWSSLPTSSLPQQTELEEYTYAATVSIASMNVD